MDRRHDTRFIGMNSVYITLFDNWLSTDYLYELKQFSTVNDGLKRFVAMIVIVTLFKVSFYYAKALIETNMKYVFDTKLSNDLEMICNNFKAIL